MTIEKHRKKKTSFAKAKYALVEFAHKDSVEVTTEYVVLLIALVIFTK